MITISIRLSLFGVIFMGLLMFGIVNNSLLSILFAFVLLGFFAVIEIIEGILDKMSSMKGLEAIMEQQKEFLERMSIKEKKI